MAELRPKTVVSGKPSTKHTALWILFTVLVWLLVGGLFWLLKSPDKPASPTTGTTRSVTILTSSTADTATHPPTITEDSTTTQPSHTTAPSGTTNKSTTTTADRTETTTAGSSGSATTTTHSSTTSTTHSSTTSTTHSSSTSTTRSSITTTASTTRSTATTAPYPITYGEDDRYGYRTLSIEDGAYNNEAYYLKDYIESGEYTDKILITEVHRIADDGIYRIPESINGKTVVGIAPNAFYASGAKIVLLPKTLRLLHAGCFGYDTTVTDIYFPGNILAIGDYALYSDDLKRPRLHCSAQCVDSEGNYYRNLSPSVHRVTYTAWDGVVNF